jgi:hypothetical protein
MIQLKKPVRQSGSSPFIGRLNETHRRETPVLWRPSEPHHQADRPWVSYNPRRFLEDVRAQNKIPAAIAERRQDLIRCDPAEGHGSVTRKPAHAADRSPARASTTSTATCPQ